MYNPELLVLAIEIPMVSRKGIESLRHGSRVESGAALERDTKHAVRLAPDIAAGDGVSQVMFAAAASTSEAPKMV